MLINLYNYSGSRQRNKEVLKRFNDLYCAVIIMVVLYYGITEEA